MERVHCTLAQRINRNELSVTAARTSLSHLEMMADRDEVREVGR